LDLPGTIGTNRSLKPDKLIVKDEFVANFELAGNNQHKSSTIVCDLIGHFGRITVCIQDCDNIAILI